MGNNLLTACFSILALTVVVVVSTVVQPVMPFVAGIALGMAGTAAFIACARVVFHKEA